MPTSLVGRRYGGADSITSPLIALTLCMSGDTTGDFIINALTGDLISQPLDRELMDVYHLTVAAVDAGQPPLTSLTTLTVHVLDDNDHCPQFQVRECFC